MLRVLQFILTFPPPTLLCEYITFPQFLNFLPKVSRWEHNGLTKEQDSTE